MMEIRLTQGKFTRINDEDWDKVSKYRWFFDGSYAANKSPKKIYMHRLIMQPNKGLEVDHINGDKLDNRKSNLRIVTHSHNMMNRGKQVNNTSGYKGVTWWKRDGNWKAQIKLKGKNINLGYFEKIEDAVKARKAAEKIYHKIESLYQ